MPQNRPIGPTKGSLVIVGGGAQGIVTILRRFLALAGGLNAPIIIISTAAEEEYDGPYAPHKTHAIHVG